jgi:hypothetical protein
MYKFTNAYRASDRTSQYLIKNVIYSETSAAEEVLFRILLFKIFNKAETWELLKQTHGEPSLQNFSVLEYDQTLASAMQKGMSIYSAAYIMPSGSKEHRKPRKHSMHLRILERMRDDHFFARIASVRTMKTGYDLLRSYQSLGPFLSYQFITDLNYSDVLRLSEMEFVMPGPGARDGLRKCFSSYGEYSESDVVRWVADRQEMEFDNRGLVFHLLGGERRLQLIDCQNLFCEVDKYARVMHPEVTGVSGRTRIKQRFVSRGPIPQPIYPPHWNMANGVAGKTPAKVVQLPLL